MLNRIGYEDAVLNSSASNRDQRRVCEDDYEHSGFFKAGNNFLRD
jgi:hypothetical protein